MALALESSVLVKQKVKSALGGGAGAGSGSSPIASAAFEALFSTLANQYGNPNLQFFAFSEVQADDADGTGIVDAACQVYGVYVKKEASDTDSVFKLFDSATVDTTDTEQTVALPLLIASESVFTIYPDGLPHAAGVTVTQHTTSVGATDSSTGGDGFLIVGAA